MCSLVLTQVDAVSRARHRGDESVGELAILPDDREDGPVVIGIRVHVEDVCVRAECLPQSLERGCVAALREVRHGLERQLHESVL